MGTENPYPNGLIWRVTEVERRMGAIEEGRKGTITGEIAQDIRELKDELRGVKRAFWAMTGTFSVFIAVLLQVFGTR